MKINLIFHVLLVDTIIGVCLVQPLLAHIQSSNDYSSYTRHPLCGASDPIRYPKNAEQVVGIVNEAIERGVTVKAFGIRHSVSDIICTDGIPIDMQLLKSFKMNNDKTATFGAGVTLDEAGDYLLPYGRALRVFSTLGNSTLVGSVGTGSHGSSIKFNSSLSTQIAKMTIVNGLGEVQRISSREDLRSFKVHLGLLGIIVDLTLYTVPLYKVKRDIYFASDDVLVNGEAINWAKTSDQIRVTWYPSLNEVAVRNESFVSAETVGNVKTTASNSFEFNVRDTIYKESAFNLSTSDCTTASTLGKKMLQFLEMRARGDNVPPIVGYPHDILAAICGEDTTTVLHCSWFHPKPYSREILDSEFDFPLNDLPAVARTIKDIVQKTSVAFPYGIIIRFSAKNDLYMSTSYERDSCHMEIVFDKRSDAYNDASGNLAGLQTIFQALTKKFNARSHWGKSGLIYHSNEMLDLKLDSFARERFIAAMQKFDPNGIFLNNFGRRLTDNGTKLDVDPLTTRCALLDNCFCSNSTDCGNNQICTSVSGYNYRVCETKNVIATEFNRNDFPANFEAGYWFFNYFPPLINSLKC